METVAAGAEIDGVCSVGNVKATTMGHLGGVGKRSMGADSRHAVSSANLGKLPRVHRRMRALAWGVWMLVLGWSSVIADEAVVSSRVARDIRFLASDELEGRGPGTAGLEKAGDYIRDAFRQLGLNSGTPDGTYRQPFHVTLDAAPVAGRSTVTLRGPEGREWTLESGRDFQPLAVGGSGTASAPLVFAGYGISAPTLGYDDYEGLDVEGKVLVIFRHEPQQDDADSRFDGKASSKHAYISTKLQQAKQRKAAGVLMVNPPATTATAGRDQLSAPHAFGSKPGGVPFVQVSQAVIDELLVAAPLQTPCDTLLTNAVDVEKRIDVDLRPVSQPLVGWSADIEVTFERSMVETANIIGVLEGVGPLAEETIVVGAHYDHIGRGEFASRRPDSSQIHNGADDNASGTAAILELARRMTAREQPPPRRLVFIGFSGEEKGLVGSNHYVQNPLFPVEDTVTMLNFDMIGRLRNDELTVFGVRSADEFSALLDRANGSTELNLKKVDSSPARGDHYPFYQRGIPALHFFTGMTPEYHTPEDTFETINVSGVVRTIDFAEQVLDQVLASEPRLTFVKGGGGRAAGDSTAYLGITPDHSAASEGVLVSAVAEKSPAAEGGIQPGDVILRFADSAVSDLPGLMNGLRKSRPGDIVKIEIRRDQQSVTCTVTLGRPQGS